MITQPYGILIEITKIKCERIWGYLVNVVCHMGKDKNTFHYFIIQFIIF